MLSLVDGRLVGSIRLFVGAATDRRTAKLVVHILKHKLQAQQANPERPVGGLARWPKLAALCASLSLLRSPRLLQLVWSAAPGEEDADLQLPLSGELEQDTCGGQMVGSKRRLRIRWHGRQKWRCNRSQSKE